MLFSSEASSEQVRCLDSSGDSHVIRWTYQRDFAENTRGDPRDFNICTMSQMPDQLASKRDVGLSELVRFRCCLAAG